MGPLFEWRKFEIPLKSLPRRSRSHRRRRYSYIPPPSQMLQHSVVQLNLLHPHPHHYRYPCSFVSRPDLRESYYRPFLFPILRLAMSAFLSVLRRREC